MDIRVLIKINHPAVDAQPYGVGVYELTRSSNGSLYWSVLHRAWGYSYGYCFNILSHFARNLPILTTTIILGGGNWKEEVNNLKLEDFPLEFEDELRLTR